MSWDEFVAAHHGETPEQTVDRLMAAHPEGLSAEQLAAIANLVVAATSSTRPEKASRGRRGRAA